MLVSTAACSPALSFSAHLMPLLLLICCSRAAKCCYCRLLGCQTASRLRYQTAGLCRTAFWAPTMLQRSVAVGSLIRWGEWTDARSESWENELIIKQWQSAPRSPKYWAESSKRHGCFVLLTCGKKTVELRSQLQNNLKIHVRYMDCLHHDCLLRSLLYVYIYM